MLPKGNNRGTVYVAGRPKYCFTVLKYSSLAVNSNDLICWASAAMGTSSDKTDCRAYTMVARWIYRVEINREMI